MAIPLSRLLEESEPIEAPTGPSTPIPLSRLLAGADRPSFFRRFVPAPIEPTVPPEMVATLGVAEPEVIEPTEVITPPASPPRPLPSPIPEIRAAPVGPEGLLARVLRRMGVRRERPERIEPRQIAQAQIELEARERGETPPPKAPRIFGVPSPVEAVKAGARASIPGMAAELAAKGTLDRQLIQRDPEYDPTLVDRAVETLVSIGLDTPAFLVGGLIGGVPARWAVGQALTRLTERAMARGFASDVAKEIAQRTFRLHAAKQAAVATGAGRGAGMFAVRDALAESIRGPLETGEFKPTEVVTAGAKGAALGATVFGPAALVTQPTLRFLTEVGLFGAASPPIQEGRPPTLEDLVEAGVALGTLRVAFTLPRRMQQALRRAPALRTRAEQAELDAAAQEVRQTQAAEAEVPIEERLARLREALDRQEALVGRGPAVIADVLREAARLRERIPAIEEAETKARREQLRRETVEERASAARGIPTEDLPEFIRREVEQQVSEALGRRPLLAGAELEAPPVAARVVEPFGQPERLRRIEAVEAERRRSEEARFPTVPERVISRRPIERPAEPERRLELELQPEIPPVRAPEPPQVREEAPERALPAPPAPPEPAVPPEPRPAPVEWFGWQERLNRPPLAQWTLTEDIPGHPKDSTLSTETLQREGFAVPEPPEPAPATMQPVTPARGPGREEPTRPQPPEPEGGKILRPDWIEDLESVGGKIDADGTILLYHATTKDKAIQIEKDGLLRRPPDAPDSYGVFFGTDPVSLAESYGDGTVVPVRVKATDLFIEDVATGRWATFYAKTRKGIYRPVAVGKSALRPSPPSPPSAGGPLPPTPPPSALRAEAPAPRPPRIPPPPSEGPAEPELPEMPRPRIPPTPIRPAGEQRPVEETPLFGQERARRERVLEEAQVEILAERQAPPLPPPVPRPAPRRGPPRAEPPDLASFNLDDAEAWGRIIQSRGRLRPSEAIRGEMREDVPWWLHAKRGQGIPPDELTDEVARARNLEPSEVERRMFAALARSRTAQGERRALQGTEAGQPRPPEDLQDFIAIDEWQPMSLQQRMATIQFFRVGSAGAPEVAAHNRRVRKMPEEIEEIGGGTVELGAGPAPTETALLRLQLSRYRGQVDREKAKAQAAENAARQGLPPGPPTVVFHTPPKDYGIFAWIGSPANILPRYGPVPKRAIETLNLAEIAQRVEYGRRMEGDREAIAKIPRAQFGRQGEVFSQLFEGVPLDNILARPDLSEGTKAAARHFREKFDRDRTLIRDRLREGLRPSLRTQVERQLRRERAFLEEGQRRRTSEQAGQLRDRIEEETDRAVREAMPDDWGIADYLPHVFPGEFVLSVERPEGRAFIGSARTRAEALATIAEHHARNPEEQADRYHVQTRLFLSPDVVRVSTPRRWRLIGELSKRLEVDKGDIAGALRGVIGTKEGRQKWWGSLQHREGYAGFTRDLEWVLSVYNSGLSRWIHVTDASRAVEPMIRELRNQGQPNLADELEANLKILWGYKSPASAALDAQLERTPGLRTLHRPFALERWANRVKGLTAFMFLTVSPRFHFLNRLQTFQTLLPLGVRDFWRGRTFYVTGKAELPSGEVIEAKEILDRHGIRFLAGGKFLGEAGFVPRVTGVHVRERVRGLAPETFNQEIAFLTMYRKGREQGMDDAEAARYALLRGNIYSQFLGLRTDQPRAIYRQATTGLQAPVKSAIFQFRRFQVKNLEIGLDLLRNRNLSGATMWLGSQILIGGLKGLTNPFVALAGGAYVSLQVYEAIKKEYGETLANVVAYGLPGLLGMDMSYSTQLFDVPYGSTIQEAVGNLALGPAGSTVVSGITAALGKQAEKGVVEEPLERFFRAIRQRAPGLRWIESLEQLWSGQYDFRDPQGRLKFKGDLQDVLLNMGGFRTLTQADQDLILSAFLELRQRRDRALDRAAQPFAGARAERRTPSPEEWKRGREAIAEWNGLYPEVPVTMGEVQRRAKGRMEALTEERLKRTIERGPKALRRAFQGRQRELTKEAVGEPVREEAIR